MGVYGNLQGFNCGKFVNLMPKKRFLSSSGGLAPFFYQICPHRPPKNDCPNQGAQLIPLGVIWGVKQTHSRTFSEDNLSIRTKMAVFGNFEIFFKSYFGSK